MCKTYFVLSGYYIFDGHFNFLILLQHKDFWYMKVLNWEKYSKLLRSFVHRCNATANQNCYDNWIACSSFTGTTSLWLKSRPSHLIHTRIEHGTLNESFVSWSTIKLRNSRCIRLWNDSRPMIIMIHFYELDHNHVTNHRWMKEFIL